MVRFSLSPNFKTLLWVGPKKTRPSKGPVSSCKGPVTEAFFVIDGCSNLYYPHRLWIKKRSSKSFRAFSIRTLI